jgi:leader peptidase (prepilin peptidase) / N-methyltransferase
LNECSTVDAVTVSSERKLTTPRWLAELADSYSIIAPGTRLLLVLLAVAAVIVSLTSAPDAIGILGAGLALLMMAIALIDWHRFIIPNELTGAGLGLAMVHAVVREPEAMLTSLTFAAIRCVSFALALLAIRYAYKWVRGREGIGLGDVKLAGVAGAWLDWAIMPIALEIAACTALLVYLLRQFAAGQPVRATNRLPFGLFFAPAIWLCWVLETTVLDRF